MLRFVAVQNATGDVYVAGVSELEREDPATAALRFIGFHVLGMKDAFQDGFDTGNVDFDLYPLPEAFSVNPPTQKLEKA